MYPFLFYFKNIQPRKMTDERKFEVGELVSAKQGIFNMAANVTETIGNPVEKYRIRWAARAVGGDWETIVSADEVTELTVGRKRRKTFSEPPPTPKEKRKSESKNVPKKKPKVAAKKASTKKSTPKKSSTKRTTDLHVGDSVKAFQGRYLSDGTVSSVGKLDCKVKWDEPFDMSLEEETISRDSIISPLLDRQPRKPAPKKIAHQISSFKNTSGIPKDDYEEGETVMAYCGGSLLNAAVIKKKQLNGQFVIEWEVPFPNQRKTIRLNKNMIQGVRITDEDAKRELYNYDPHDESDVRISNISRREFELSTDSDDSLYSDSDCDEDRKGRGTQKLQILVEVCADLVSRVSALEKTLSTHQANCTCETNNSQNLSQQSKSRNAYSPKLYRCPKKLFEPSADEQVVNGTL